MKRMICVLLILCALIPLSGCGSENETARFHYRRVRFEYGTAAQDSVIASENRNITGHRNEISYLISLYLAGPLDESLSSPFPQDIRLYRAYQTDSTLFIELSDVGEDFGSAQFSLACACLSLTCMELTDAEEVNILSGERSVTLQRDSLILYDDITENDPTLDNSMEAPQ